MEYSWNNKHVKVWKNAFKNSVKLLQQDCAGAGKWSLILTAARMYVTSPFSTRATPTSQDWESQTQSSPDGKLFFFFFFFLPKTAPTLTENHCEFMSDHIAHHKKMIKLLHFIRGQNQCWDSSWLPCRVSGTQWRPHLLLLRHKA